MFIAGRNCPNFRVLSDFRKNHGVFFIDCFKQTAQLGIELKLASLGHVSLDGAKFKANSSKHKAMSYQRMKAHEKQLCEEIKALIAQAERCDREEDEQYQERTGYELPEDLKYKQSRLEKIRSARQALEAREAELNPGEAIEGKKQISFADHDARIMGKKGSGFEYAYNPQISVDSQNQLIVGQHVSQRANDQQEVETALEQIEQTCGELPDKMSLDNGYYSGANLESLEDKQVEAYVATDRSEKAADETLEASTRRLVKADFEYDEADDYFHCPGGQDLVLVRLKKPGKRLYQGDARVCAECPYQKRCCQSKTGEARTISTDDKEPLRRRMNERMSRPVGKEIYARRKVIVEPVFGQIKNSGFRGFSVRGKERVSGEFSLVCAAHNMKKMVKAMTSGLIRPDEAKWAIAAS